MTIVSIILRTIFFYLFVIICYRLMGKREIGQLDVIDLMVSILIAELMAMSIENYKENLFITIAPIISLVLLEILLAFISIKSRKFRLFIDGKPSLIIANGKINYHEMIKQRYSLDNLLLSLRQNEIKNIDEVEYAFLETNGKLSIFKYNKDNNKSVYPLPLILDGEIVTQTLDYIHKNKEWLINKLHKYNLKIDNVFYCFFNKNKFHIIKKSEIL